MKNLNYIWIALTALLLLSSCGDDDSSPTNPPTQIEEPSDQKQFVWKAMNLWYYWQADVPELADNYFTDNDAYYEYLNGFSDAQATFDALQYEEDGFSFFISDYEEHQQSQQGISRSFGYQYGLVCMEGSQAACEQGNAQLFGYVQYVLDGEPANEAGLERGDVFTSVDGTRLTVNNYRDLLRGRTSYELTLAEVEGNTITETNDTRSLEAVELQEDPVHIAKVLDGTNIGYLMYNSFQLNSHRRLNDVFETFASQGVDELVVDLRYNGGGTGLSSQLLGSLISGFDSSTDFATYSHNDKVGPSLDTTETFLDQAPLFENREQVGEEPLNALSLNRVYFLVDYGTASASEMLINALNPHMEIILIGGQTTGKDVGSYTLYDSPSFNYNEEEINPNHKVAVQPITLKLVNSQGEGYPNGFTPDPNEQINELDYLEDLPALGDKSDPLLARALELITGQQARVKTTAPAAVHRTLLTNSRELQPYGNQLEIAPPANIKERLKENR